MHFRTSEYSIAGFLLVGLLLVAFLATGAHVVSSSHASAYCAACTCFQILGGIVAFILSIRQDEFCPRPFAVLRLPLCSRAPPLA